MKTVFKRFIPLLMLATIAAICPTLTSRNSLVEAQTDERRLKVGRANDQDGGQASTYFALVIGNNDYVHMPKLKTAVNDSEAVANILRDTYSFKINLLRNASRDQILTALNGYRRTLDDSANLLIYYAGHGYKDQEVDKAYWLPVDAERENNVKWISADDITTNIKGIQAKHILVISDSCYSGMISREGAPKLTPLERGRYLKKMAEGKCRIVMSSGGDEPVADNGGGNHSVFANALLRGLVGIDEDAFTAEELFYQFIREPVAGKSDQTPQYNPIHNSGHDSGDFVFLRKKKNLSTTEPASDLVSPNVAESIQKHAGAASPSQPTTSTPKQLANQQKGPDKSIADLRRDLDRYTVKKIVTVLFNAGKSDITPQATDMLNELANQIKDRDGFLLEIEGFDSSEGDATASDSISRERASAVRYYFADQHKIPLFRMSMLGFGQSRPVADNSTDEGRKQNRRVEVRLLTKLNQ